MHFVFTYKTIVVVTIQIKILYGTLYISNDELQLFDDKNDDIADHADTHENDNQYYIVGLLNNNNENGDSEYIDDLVEELAINGNELKTGYLYKVLRLKSPAEDINDLDVKGSLRTQPSILDFQLEQAKDITEYIKLKDQWVKDNHRTKDNIIKPVASSYHQVKLSCLNKGTMSKITKPPESDECDCECGLPIERTRRKQNNLPKHTKKKQIQRSKKKKKIHKHRSKNRTQLRSRAVKRKKKNGKGLKNGNKRVKLSGPGYAKRPKKRPDKEVYKKVLERREKNKQAKLAAVRKAKVDKIIEFLQPHVLTTRYIHYELKRIDEKKEIRDKLRKMVYMMELPFFRKTHLAKDVLTCYKQALALEDKSQAHWMRPVNNLVINVMKDAQNDGVQ